MTPDLEVPIIFLLTGGLQDRLILHSLMGVVTLGTFLSVLLTVFLYPRLVSFFFRLEKKRVYERCRFSSILVISCVVGGLSHVLIDSMTHEFNPVFYPFFKESFDALVFLNDRFVASVIVECVLLTLLVLFFIDEIGKGFRGFWKRVLVE